MIFDIKIITFFAIAIKGIAGVYETEECKSDHCFEDVGCFNSRQFLDEIDKYAHFIRKAANLVHSDAFSKLNNDFMICPADPTHADVHFRLYTPNSTQNVILTYKADTNVLENSGFDPELKTLFVVHGYVDKYRGCDDYQECHWMERIKNYFISHDYNVVAVDWSKVGSSPNYFNSAFNTRVIGAMIATFIRRLVDVFHYKPKQVELMGHSLGGQLVGFVGKHFNETGHKIGMISGLDPAGPGFDTQHLEPTDAELVIAVHTSAGILKSLDLSSSVNPLNYIQIVGFTGTELNVGDFDFWLNGGNGQPGCEESLDAFKAITGGLLAFGNRMACSHMRATELPIAERLLRDNTNHTPEQEECQWVGYQCKSYINFQEGLCSDCGDDGKKCKLIEYLPEFWLKPDNLVDVQENYPQNLYMLTSGTPPYCVFHYMIELKMDDTVKYEGKIEFKLNGTQMVTFKRKFYAYPNTTTYNFLYTSQQHLGQITEIDIQYETTLIGDLVKASQILNPFTFLNEIKKEDINISNISVIFMSNIDKSVRDGYSSHLVPNPSKKSEGGYHFIVDNSSKSGKSGKSNRLF